MKEFVFIGDWGQAIGDEAHLFPNAWIKRLDEISCHEFFLLGDNFYPSGVDSLNDGQWEDKMQKYFPKKKIKNAVLGNHDYILNPYAQIQFTFLKKNYNWNLPYFFHEKYYKDVSCQIFMIDTQLNSPLYTPAILNACNVQPEQLQDFYRYVDKLQEQQIRWLETSLKNSDAKWKIVIGHYPILSNGFHESSIENRQIVKPLLEKYNVDIYFSGHDHNLQILNEKNTNYVISGALSYFNVPPEKFKKETKFIGSEKGVIKLNIQKNSIDFFHCSLEKQHFIYTLIKN